MMSHIERVIISRAEFELIQIANNPDTDIGHHIYYFAGEGQHVRRSTLANIAIDRSVGESRLLCPRPHIRGADLPRPNRAYLNTHPHHLTHRSTGIRT